MGFLKTWIFYNLGFISIRDDESGHQKKGSIQIVDLKFHGCKDYSNRDLKSNRTKFSIDLINFYKSKKSSQILSTINKSNLYKSLIYKCKFVDLQIQINKYNPYKKFQFELHRTPVFKRFDLNRFDLTCDL